MLNSCATERGLWWETAPEQVSETFTGLKETEEQGKGMCADQCCSQTGTPDVKHTSFEEKALHKDFYRKASSCEENTIEHNKMHVFL